MLDKPIRIKDRDAIFQSLAAGVVPSRGQQHIQVGRAQELDAVIGDLDRISEGGSSVRFIIGPYGSGKTFFLLMTRAIALEKGLVTVNADLAPGKRLHATGGQARNLYAELSQNLSTRSKPQGHAIQNIVEKFITSARKIAADRDISVSNVILERLASFEELSGGYEFAQVINAYWQGFNDGNDELSHAAVRWLRGEYLTRTDARRDLGVRGIIDDSNLYDSIRLLAKFVVAAGYSGLLVTLDEMVNLLRLSNTQARKNNYEQILRIVNDGLQGGSESLGIFMGGTPEFLHDTRRGLFSYEALQTRLQENQFAREGLKDFTGPVLRLANLSPEELYVLLKNLRHVHALGDTSKYLVPDACLTAFLDHCNKRVGAQYFQTPRNTIKAFVHLLAVLDQNPDTKWEDLLSDVTVQQDREEIGPEISEDDSFSETSELARFRL